MPKLGLTMTEGLLASWRVGPGDRVRPGDVLFVVETEKIATEIEAQGEGEIRSLEVRSGETVPVGAVVATWTGPAAVSGDSIQARPELAPAEAASSAAPSERVVATPLARRLAREGGIDLSALRGSGPNGRIKAADVESLLRANGPARDIRKADARPAVRRPATPVEKVVARRLTASKQTIPHFYVLAEADATSLIAAREELNAGGGLRLSVNHFVLAALARALVELPDMNAVWDDEAIAISASVDIGIAVDTERGLMVPVLRDAGALSLDDIAAAATTLVERARSGGLQAADVEGAAISVSNVGMHGAAFLVPIIDPGQSAILGVGAVKPVFRPDERGAPALRQELGLVLSCDHRVFDGVRAARFLARICHHLQHPLRLLRR